MSGNDDAKKLLKLPDPFTAYDWVVVSAYYSMYHASLAALAEIGYRSKNHSATIIALEVLFVRKKLLEIDFIDALKDARSLEGEYIETIRRARRQRETAQYMVTKDTGKNIAESSIARARSFVNRMDALIMELKAR